MKRSNRLVLLIGIFLAIVAFVAIALLLNNGQGTPGPGGQTQTTVKVVVAARDLPFGTQLDENAVETKEVPVPAPAGSFQDESQAIGQIVGQAVKKGQLITTALVGGGDGSIGGRIEVPAGKVAIAVQVDQVTGVGTVIKTADYVDMVVGITGDKFPVVTINPEDQSITVVAGINTTSVKVLLQGMQVLGTLLPPPPTEQNQQQTGTGDTALTGQQELVILAVTTQQAEIIKYSQLDANISLTLRSAAEFRDPLTGEPLDPAAVPTVPTTGVTLRGLVDQYGVLVPELVEAILPEASPAP